MGLVCGSEIDQGREETGIKQYSPEQEPSFTAFCEARIRCYMITFNMQRGDEGF